MDGSGDQEPLQLLPFPVPDPGLRQILKNHADRLQRQDRYGSGRTSIQSMELGKERLSFLLRHEYIDSAHELRNVFCHGVLSHAEGAHQLKDDLIALGL